MANLTQRAGAWCLNLLGVSTMKRIALPLPLSLFLSESLSNIIIWLRLCVGAKKKKKRRLKKKWKRSASKKDEWRGSRWSGGAAGQAAVQWWPQIDSSVSVHPARSCTQHPHCLLCQGVEAALPSSGGRLRQAKIHVSLFLIFLYTPSHGCVSRFSFLFFSCWSQLPAQLICVIHEDKCVCEERATVRLSLFFSSS